MQVVSFLLSLITQAFDPKHRTHILVCTFWNWTWEISLQAQALPFTSSHPVGELFAPAEPQQPLLCGGENANINSMELL